MVLNVYIPHSSLFILSLYFHLTGRQYVMFSFFIIIPKLTRSLIRLTYYGAWPSMIIWGFDRLLRLIELVVYNFAYLNPFSSRTSASLNASVEVLSPEFLRLTLRRPARLLKWRAGQSVFLSFPSVAAFPLESHPFTIATIDDDADTASAEKKLMFILRVRSGFTKRLLDTASPGATYPVFINGPCSSPPILVGYQTVILIAGSPLFFIVNNAS